MFNFALYSKVFKKHYYMLINLSHPGLEDFKNIKNIIFDFGGVICNIDLKLTEQKFKELGLSKFDSSYSAPTGESIFSIFEAGKITPQQFRDAVKKYLPDGVTDNDIDSAWNAMLLDIPAERIRLLEEIRKNYRIFLLSNSNEIHYQEYLHKFQEKFGYKDFDDLFEKAYFSFRLKMQKPNRDIFDYVVKNNHLAPGETLFIDDSIQHIEGARKALLNAYHLKPGEEIINLFH